MTEEKKTTEDNAQILKKLSELERKIESSKKDKLVDSEDQLFFGVVVSFLILFVTLPISDFTVFLQDTFHLVNTDALALAESVRYLGIVLSLLSALTRYYAVVGNQIASKKYRYISLEGFMFALASILVILSINMVSALASLSHIIALVIIVIMMDFMIILMTILERRILSFYVAREFISKKYAFPFSSFVWLSFIIGITLADAIQFFALSLGVSAEFLLLTFNSTWGLIAISFGTLYFLKWAGLKPTKDNDYYKLKMFIRIIMARLKRSIKKN